MMSLEVEHDLTCEAPAGTSNTRPCPAMYFATRVRHVMPAPDTDLDLNRRLAEHRVSCQATLRNETRQYAGSTQSGHCS